MPGPARAGIKLDGMAERSPKKRSPAPSRRGTKPPDAARARPPSAARAKQPTPTIPAARPGTAGEVQRIDLALQGGGSHGAFTWGVLDRLLEDETLAFDGVSGTSAGALNAAVLATGLARGGRPAAREALRAFWLEVAGSPCFGTSSDAAPPAANPWAAWTWPAAWNPWGLLAWLSPRAPGLAGYNLDGRPGYAWATHWLRSLTPEQLNPLGLNRLREVAMRHVDPDALRDSPVELFVTATSVASGRPRVFDRHDLTLDALLASACLPQLFRPVLVDGEPYWDGGYTGNPAIWPLIYETRALDIVLVKINPLRRERLPASALEIADRVNEITFNAGLVGEMRAIEFVQRLLREGRIDPGHYKDLRLHMVADDEGLAPLQPSSKLNTDRRFLLELHALGRAAAERWLARDRPKVGVESSLDIARVFLDRPPAAPVLSAADAAAGTPAAPD